jgi:uncharacterized protein (TIGR03118 family)
MKIAFGVACLAGLSAIFLGGAGALPPAGSTYTQHNLVSDVAGQADKTDPELVNPWGISHLGGGAPNWVSDNGTDRSTVYSRTTGDKSLSVGVVGAPTGTVANSTGGFVVSKGGNSGSAIFLFDTEAGTILGWSQSVDPGNAVLAVDNSSKGSVYKGLAIDPASKQLYAADFAKNQVQIFDANFKLVGRFTDPELPKRFAPFNVTELNGKIYVAFAKREKGGIDEVHGKGLGYVDVFDISGNLQQRLIANGKLNAPWGMTIAPSGFGQFANALLVGNFGDGKINAFDASTGAYLGTLKGANGKPLVIDGLWAVDSGPSSSQITFSAGPEDEQHGLLGLITLAQ